jgi:signal peptidase
MDTTNTTTVRYRLTRIGGGLLTAVMIAALSLFVAMTVLRITGGELLAVRTGSMEPGMAPGDLVVSRKADPRTVRRGDVITVRVPSAGNVLVTHRVVKVSKNGNTFTTKGDANDKADPFVTTGDNVLGRQWFAVPGVGHAMVFLSTGWGALLLVAVPGLIYAGQMIVDRRRAQHEEQADGAQLEADDRDAEQAGRAVAGWDVSSLVAVETWRLPADIAQRVGERWAVVVGVTEHPMAAATSTDTSSVFDQELWPYPADGETPATA